MCNCKLKISIMWSTIYAVTALSKWGLPCLFRWRISASFFYFLFIQPYVFWWGFHFLCYLKSGQEVHISTMSLRSPNYLWQVPPGCWWSTERWKWTHKTAHLEALDWIPTLVRHTYLSESQTVWKDTAHKHSPEGLSVYCLQITSTLSYGS